MEAEAGERILCAAAESLSLLALVVYRHTTFNVAFVEVSRLVNPRVRAIVFVKDTGWNFFVDVDVGKFGIEVGDGFVGFY